MALIKAHKKEVKRRVDRFRGELLLGGARLLDKHGHRDEARAITAQIYNDIEDYEKLGKAVLALRSAD